MARVAGRRGGGVLGKERGGGGVAWEARLRGGRSGEARRGGGRRKRTKREEKVSDERWTHNDNNNSPSDLLIQKHNDKDDFLVSLKRFGNYAYLKKNLLYSLKISLREL